MRRYDPGLPLAGLHIPKTAGTSVREVLQAWFPGSRLRLHYAIGKALPPRHTLTGGDCVYGHFSGMRGSGIWDYYPEIEQHFTFFRDPFERFVSQWRHLNGLAQTAAKKAVTERAAATQAAGPLGRLTARLRPTEVRGSEAARSEPGSDNVPFDTWIHRRAEQQSRGRNSFSFVWHMPRPPGCRPVDDLLDRSFVFVGLCDDLPRSIDALAVVLGRPRLAVPHLNGATGVSEDLSRWRSFFEKHFPDEMELYEKGRERGRSLIRDIAA